MVSDYADGDYIRDKEEEIRGRLPVTLMALVALALVLSLVAALAPYASAQDSGAAPDGAAKWMRYKLPTGEQGDIVTSVNPPPMVIPKDCCITVNQGCIPIPTSGVNPEPAAAPSLMPYPERPRWYCNGIPK